MPDLTQEVELRGEGCDLVAGVDEAGRGPLAGPVVAAAVIVADDFPADLAAGIDDSKRLDPQTRVQLSDEIHRRTAVGLAIATVGEIERLNILHATMLAMERAIAALPVSPAAALIDGNRAPRARCQTRTVIGGDGLSLSIAAASIVAKVARDRMMVALAEGYPGYGWERNMGYSTREHLAALDRLGATEHHRRGFAPVARLMGPTADPEIEPLAP